MEKIEYATPDRSDNEENGYLLGTFFRDCYEEQRLTESETDDRPKSGKTENNYLRDDVTIFELLLGNGAVSVTYRPDRIEVRSPQPPPEM